ncbi:hypothetical protein AB2906_21550, partial [Escherichia coli]
DRNRSHWSTSKTPSYTKSVSWQHHRQRVFLSHGYNNYLQKRERMHILNITEVNSLFPLLIEMEK